MGRADSAPKLAQDHFQQKVKEKKLIKKFLKN